METTVTSVLVVEDEAEIRRNLQVYLEDEGMVTAGVETCEQAMALLASGRRFDVCIVDLLLHGMRGDDGILALRELDVDLRFLIHTGSCEFSPTPELRQLGIGDEHVFFKPVEDMGKLADAVRWAPP